MGLAAAAAVVAILAVGSVANAVVFADASAPLTLTISGVEVGQTRGSVSSVSGQNLAYTSGYQRDRSVNGNATYTTINTDYSTLIYDDLGNLIGSSSFTNQARVRTSGSQSAAWTREPDTTKSISKSGLNLSKTAYTARVAVCEDRGLLNPDVCKVKLVPLTLVN